MELIQTSLIKKKFDYLNVNAPEITLPNRKVKVIVKKNKSQTPSLEISQETETKVPFYVKASDIFLLKENIRFINTPDKDDFNIVLLGDEKWNIISKSVLKRKCKAFLREFINNEMLQALNKNEKTTHEDLLNYGINITDFKEILEKAKKNNFTLTKERKLFMDELFDTLEMYKTEEDFLAPDHILPFLNGYLNLRDGKFYNYSSNGFNGFLYQLDANYNPEYEADRLPQEFYDIISNGLYNQYLSQHQNEKRIATFLNCLAYSFIPTNFLRKLFIVIDPTATGKSTIMSIIRKIFGELGLHLQSYSIMKQSRYDHELRPDLKAAIDKFWLDISETDDKQVIDAVTIKSFTGNDPLTFRDPHSKLRYTKLMKCKIWLITNSFPKIINYNDFALQDRLVIFDWNNTVSKESRDNMLIEKLTTQENRDRIATFFANMAAELCYNKTLKIDPSFGFNTFKYFTGHGDTVALLDMFDNS